MKKLFLSVVTFLSCDAFALPDKVEIIFLSEPQGISLLKKEVLSFGPALAQNEHNCIPMGDGCFHPQLGFIENEGPKAPPVQPSVEVKTINAMDVNLVDCREGEYFDIFCGKASKEDKKLSDIEVWIDTSASLRKMDFSTDPHSCERKRFAQTLQRECNGNITFQVYDTSIKTMSTFDSLCQSYGSNDRDRMEKWIRASQAKYLLIVTDIDELSSEFRTFLDSIGAKYYGGDVKDVTVKDFDKYVGLVKKHCS